MPNHQSREVSGSGNCAQAQRIAAAYTPEQRQLLCGLARRGLAERAQGRVFEPEHNHIPPNLQEVRACFVTLFRQGELRGCIGQVRPQIPLFIAAVRNACAAGFHDSRFTPVSLAEVTLLKIEISVLSDPLPVAGTADEIVSRLRPRIDGVLIEHNGMMATFLPQVWEHLDDKIHFMQRLCQKAGLEKECWKHPNATISVYSVESFESM